MARPRRPLFNLHISDERAMDLTAYRGLLRGPAHAACLPAWPTTLTWTVAKALQKGPFLERIGRVLLAIVTVPPGLVLLGLAWDG
jgi:hypothetical protein